MQLAQRFPTKPNFTNEHNRNTVVNVCSNLVKIRFKPKEDYVFIYALKVFPELPNDSTLFYTLIKNLHKYVEADFKMYCISGNNLLSTRKHSNSMEYNILINVKRESKDRESSSNSPNTSDSESKGMEERGYKVTITPTNRVVDLTSPGDFSLLYKSFVERVVKTILSANESLLKFRNNCYFNRLNHISLNIQGLDKAYLVAGYTTSVVNTERGMFLKLAYKNKFINGESCLEKINKIEKRYRSGEEIKQAIETAFTGKSVMANYGNYRIYQVIKVCFNLCPRDVKFKVRLSDNTFEEMNLVNYYKKQYNKTINENQLLFSCSKERNNKETEIPLEDLVYLIPELCVVTGMEDELRNDDKIKREMLMKTKLDAKTRVEKILQINSFLKYNETSNNKKRSTPKEISENWGFQVRPELDVFNGKILSKPEINFKNQKSEIKFGKFRHSHIQTQPFKFDRTNTVFFCSRGNKEVAYKTQDSLKRCCGQMNIEIRDIENSRVVFVDEKERESERGWLKTLEEFIYSTKNDTSLFYIILIDRNSKNYYNEIKRLLHKKGIMNQAINAPSVDKPLSVMSNILIQMVEKTDGKAYHITLNNKLQSKPSTVVGIETSSTGVSISMSNDKHFSKYFTEYYSSNRSMTMDETSEMVAKVFGKLLLKLKTKFAERGPNIIIIYRTGKNESGIQALMNNEIPLIQSTIDKICPGCEVIYLTVIKKAEIRLMLQRTVKSEKDGIISYSYSYSEEGLVLDSGITRPDSYEFYLQPTCETGIPIFYRAIHMSNWNTLSIEEIEDITYRMCYSYSNWAGAIKIPSCLKHAEKQLSSNTQTKANEISEDIKSVPYYI